MKDTDLQFLLIGIGIIALAGYKYYTEQQITTQSIISFSIIFVVITIAYLLLYLVIKKFIKFNYNKNLKKIEERSKNKKHGLNKIEKAISAEKIEELKHKYEEILPIFSEPPTKQKVITLERYLDNLFKTEELIYEDFAKEHQKLTKTILEEINKTKAHLQREKEAQKIQIDLTKGIYKESELKPEQIELLKQHGYVRSRHVPLGEIASIAHYLKPRSNESLRHFFLIMSIKRYLESKEIQVGTPISRDADIIFTTGNQTWAIEVETGSVKKKKPEEFKQKIRQLREKYGKNWFIVLTHAHTIRYYRSEEYNVVKKNKVIEKINEIIGQPKKDNQIFT